MQNANHEDTSSVSDELIDLQRLLVKRVIGSSSFAKSERLSAFLSCVCELTFNGQADSINEQKIGTLVFARRPDYDSGADGIVRTQASRLRQRLEVYFSTEGVDEPIRIVLPRGGYVPRFEPRSVDMGPPAKPTSSSVEVEQDAAGPPEVLTDRPHVPGRIPILPWAIVCALVLLLLVTLLFYRRGDATGQVVNNNPIWQRLFVKGHPTLIVPADSGLVIFTGWSKQAVPLDRYIRGDYRAEAATSTDPMRAMQIDAADRRYTSIVDLEIATRLAVVASTRGSTLTVRFARDLRPNDLKGTNAILVGAAEANPWVQLFEQHMNFVSSDDLKTKIFSITNRSPHPGEPARWESAADDPEHRVFGVVALVPNLTGDGDVLLLEGTSMSGTEAACNFAFDNAKFMPFIEKIREPSGHVPHFEILIGTNNMGSSAVDTSILAWRTSK